jgi:hypothetical protein
MRTKTMLLSALLGAVGCVSAMAQTNVYSANAVGYVNVTLYPGFNLVSDPLIASPDNTVSNLFVNTNGQWKTWQVWEYNPTLGSPYTEIIGTATSWGAGGTNTLNPGQCVWVKNPSNANYSVTFVGTVPTSSSVTLYANSFNLVSTAIPASGDVVTNSLMSLTNASKLDQLWTYNPTLATPPKEYICTGTGANRWGATDPNLPWVGTGFFYYNKTNFNNTWTQSYSVNQ